jgi:hypothetical protein
MSGRFASAAKAALILRLAERLKPRPFKTDDVIYSDVFIGSFEKIVLPPRLATT